MRTLAAVVALTLAQPAPHVRLGKVVANQKPKAVLEALQGVRRAVEKCVEVAHQRVPNLQATITVRVSVNTAPGDSAVQDDYEVSVYAPDYHGPNLLNDCVIAALQTAHWPAAPTTLKVSTEFSVH